MLTGKEKRYLRGLANKIDPIYQVGKNETQDNMYQGISDALEARELIKISVLNNCSKNKDEVAQDLVENTGAELVQIIGNVIILYKESENKKTIEFK